MCPFRRFQSPLILLVVIMVLPASSMSSDINTQAQNIVADFEPLISGMSDGRTCAIVLGSFFDRETKHRDDLSADVEEAIAGIMFDTYLTKKNTTIFNWQAKRPLVIDPNFTTDRIQTPIHGLGSERLGNADISLLVVGYTHRGHTGVTVSAGLVELKSGRLVKRYGATLLPTTESLPQPDAEPLPSAEDSNPPQEKGLPSETNAAIPAVTPSETPSETVSPYGKPYGSAESGNSEMELTNDSAARLSEDISPGTGQHSLRAPVAGHREQISDASVAPRQPSNLTVPPAPILEEPGMETKIIKGANFVYEGTVMDWKKHGKGTILYDNGDRYIGEWRDDAIHGQGIYHYANGERYSGQWENGKFHGEGTYFFESGSRFSGQWLNDEKQGKGTLYRANGDKWEGYYIDSKRHGKGIFTKAGGEPVEEYWEGGRLIR